jgi:NAD(P) transhydrogenase subunit alpha
MRNEFITIIFEIGCVKGTDLLILGMITIGILTEQIPETRVALTPEAVLTLVERKVSVVVEHGAGAGACLQDTEYEHAGAMVVSRKEVFNQSDCILSVLPVNAEEISDWSRGKLLAGGLDPYSSQDLVKVLLKRHITSFSLELLPRTTLAQSMDILSSMATVSGYRAVLDAAMHLPRFFPMFMSAAGTIKPARVLILGAGVAGLQSIATARRLGAVVEVFDVRTAVKDEVHSLGGKFIEVEGAREDKSAGGYAIDQTDEFREKQRELIHEHAVKADVVICTAQIPGKRAPLLLFKGTVEAMKIGSVIVDLAASTGGNCELTRNNEAIKHNGVTIIGRSDYPSTLSLDASRMFSTNLIKFVQLIIDAEGNLNLNWTDEIINRSCLTHEGKIMHEKIKQHFNQ